MCEFILAEILTAGISRGASDIHLSVGCKPILRVDGILTPLTRFASISEEDMQTAVRELLTYEQFETFNTSREFDLGFNIDVGGVAQRFRASLFFERGFPAISLRIINAAVKTIKELGLPQELSAIVQKKSGLFLVTGPAGSGKSTTLTAMINEINAMRRAHIITIEDPIEYIHTSGKSLIQQREIGRDALNFAGAIRSALRQDPDVIMIGEMRDLETTAAALTAAETGHLVLATLHTRCASESVDRIVDIFPAERQEQVRKQLASILTGVLSQQLVPQVGGGRIAATEYLSVTVAARSNIRDNETPRLTNVMQTGASYGMHTMDQDLVRLCRKGVINRKDARTYAHDAETFERNLANART